MEKTVSPARTRPENKKIAEILSQFRENYKNFIRSFGALSDFFAQIPDTGPADGESLKPCWSNKYIPPADAIALCGFLVKYNPAVYVEIGSGNSTKFARAAITHFNLGTKIISIDPYPRAEIDSLCDDVVRLPLQAVPVRILQKIPKDNILFIDGSHLCLQNSDVTYMFNEILPSINPEVILHFHDILWPNDYPDEWKQRYYNEQYLLGVLLLFGSGYEILYSSHFVAFDPELRSQCDAVLPPFISDKCKAGGGSFWMKIKKIPKQNPPSAGII